jgi:hypothetical protein
MKPEWHTGEWTDEDTENLRVELRDTQYYRSLTNEEQHWLAELEAQENVSN